MISIFWVIDKAQLIILELLYKLSGSRQLVEDHWVVARGYSVMSDFVSQCCQLTMTPLKIVVLSRHASYTNSATVFRYRKLLMEEGSAAPYRTKSAASPSLSSRSGLDGSPMAIFALVDTHCCEA